MSLSVCPGVAMEASKVKDQEPNQQTGLADGEGLLPPASAAPRYRRVSFWRAIAGMAFALAIACAIVAVESSFELFRRSDHYNHRLTYLASRVRQMRGEIASADRELASMRVEVAARDDLARVLAAPDAQLIKLTPPYRASSANGLVAISKKLDHAVLQVSGLPQPPHGSGYHLWLLVEKGEPLDAAQFQIDAQGGAIVATQMPPREASIEASEVTVEPATGLSKPTGAIQLQGHAGARG
jgi:anti-sigma-K factor RskA